MFWIIECYGQNEYSRATVWLILQLYSVPVHPISFIKNRLIYNKTGLIINDPVLNKASHFLVHPLSQTTYL